MPLHSEGFQNQPLPSQVPIYTPRWREAITVKCIFKHTFLLDLINFLYDFFLSLQLGEAVDLNEIADQTDGFSGSDLREMCRNACIYTMRDYIKGQRSSTRSGNMGHGSGVILSVFNGRFQKHGFGLGFSWGPVSNLKAYTFGLQRGRQCLSLGQSLSWCHRLGR